MIAFAALTGPLPKVGVVAIAGIVAVALLARDTRTRAVAILGALVLAPVLLLATIWHSPQLGVVHRHPLYAVVAALVALAVLGAVASVIARRPALFGLLAVAALPFRIPIQSGGTTANLLVPLYFVVAAGALAFIVPALTNRDYGAKGNGVVDDSVTPGWVERLLALYVVLYAIQAVYSLDFQTGLQNMVFFYVPFAVMFCLLRRLRWTRIQVRRCLALITALAVLFSVIGFIEYATKTIFLNSKLIAANNVHTYFTVNSVFFDPDIFGRFLALVMILLVAVLIYSRSQREQLITTGVLAVLWAGLVFTLSRSSLGALLLGMAVLAALRWHVGRAVVVGAVVVAIGAAAVALSPTTFGLNQGLNGASSGRAGLVSGGLQMFGDRPLYGYGSGAFVTEYRDRNRNINTTLAASHTIAVTIAAEQGVIGLLPYVAFVLVAVVVLLRGSRSDPTRAAIAAAFIALVFHTQLYADFLEDPVTWALLGVGVALAARRSASRSAPQGRSERATSAALAGIVPASGP